MEVKAGYPQEPVDPDYAKPRKPRVYVGHQVPTFLAAFHPPQEQDEEEPHAVAGPGR